MNDMQIKEMVKKGDLRKKTPNRPQMQSLIRAANDCAAFAKSAPLNEQNATGIFKEIYDAFRQLGDAKWWTLGFESYSHKASIELLKSADTPSKQKLQQLPRIMDLRNDATYRGYRIPVHEARLIIDLWDETHEKIEEWIERT